MLWENEAVLLRGAHLENIIKLPEFGAHPQAPSSCPSAEYPSFAGLRNELRPLRLPIFAGSGGARADPTNPRTRPCPPASRSGAPPSPGRPGACASPLGDASARPGNGEAVGGPQPYVPATLPAAQLGSHPHLPVHGRNKYGALEIVRAGVGESLECFSKSVDSNSLAFEGSRHLENHAFTLLRAESQRGGHLYACAVHFM